MSLHDWIIRCVNASYKGAKADILACALEYERWLDTLPTTTERGTK